MMLMNPYEDTLVVLLSNKQIIFGKLKKTVTFTKIPSGRVVKIESFDYVTIEIPQDQEILDINLYKSRFGILTKDNFVYYFDFEYKDLEKNKSQLGKSFVKFTLPKTLKAIKINDDNNVNEWGLRGFVFQTTDNAFYHYRCYKDGAPIKNPNWEKVDRISPKLDKVLLLQQPLYTIISTEEVFYHEEASLSLNHKVIMPLNKEEHVTSIVSLNPKSKAFLALTNQGQILSLGSCERFRLIKKQFPLSGEIYRLEMLGITLLNGYLGKETTWKDFEDDCIGVIISNQRVFMWGYNSNGLYGDRSTKNPETPYEVTVPFINTDLFAKE